MQIKSAKARLLRFSAMSN